MKKYDNVGSSIEGTKKTSVCVSPHISVFTPPPYNNNKNYKCDTQYKKLDSHTPDSDAFRKDYAGLKINLDKEIKNAEDDEYIDDPPLKTFKINSRSHKNIRNIILLKKFSRKKIDLILSNIVIYEKDISAVDYINQKI